MKRKIFTRLAALTLLAAAAAVATAQPVARIYRVGIVSPLSAAPEPSTVRTFRGALKELGYIEGKNVIIEARYAEGRPDRMPELFAELLKLRPDVLLTGSVAGALAAKRATSKVPIVFAGVLDVFSTDIVTSLGRPGGNITGTTYAAGGASIAGKWVELLREAVPGIGHMAVLLNSADPQSTRLLQEIHTAAQAMKLKVSQFDASNESNLERALVAIEKSRAQGLIVTNAPLFGASRARLVQFAAEKRLPAVYFFNLFPDAGGLMSYGGSVEDSYRRAAVYVDRILKGANPAELPVDQASKFELVINLKAAKSLGLELPRSLLIRADRVIE